MPVVLFMANQAREVSIIPKCPDFADIRKEICWWYSGHLCTVERINQCRICFTNERVVYQTLNIKMSTRFCNATLPKKACSYCTVNFFCFLMENVSSSFPQSNETSVFLLCALSNYYERQVNAIFDLWSS